MFKPTNSGEFRRLYRWTAQSGLQPADVLAKLSPANYLDRLTDPLLLIQGVDDPRVPVREAVQMQQALEARKAPSQLILIEGEGQDQLWRS
ncbi:MAG: alpha/beta hydrolase family protein [Acidobacteriota bacterium]